MLFEVFILCLLASAYLMFIASLIWDSVNRFMNRHGHWTVIPSGPQQASAASVDKKLCRGRRLPRKRCDSVRARTLSISPVLLSESHAMASPIDQSVVVAPNRLFLDHLSMPSVYGPSTSQHWSGVIDVSASTELGNVS
jgi:hypothetical protein